METGCLVWPPSSSEVCLYSPSGIVLVVRIDAESYCSEASLAEKLDSAQFSHEGK